MSTDPFPHRHHEKTTGIITLYSEDKTHWLTQKHFHKQDSESSLFTQSRYTPHILRRAPRQSWRISPPLLCLRDSVTA